MVLEDWHTHNESCHHAKGTIEDYIRSAIKFKLRTIGLSDHFPYEFLEDIERIPYEEYAIRLPEIEEYLKSSEVLKEKYRENIIVRIGFEIDYFKNQESALSTHLNPIKKKLDFILGSIHILNFFNGKGAWGFDDSRFRGDYDFYGADKVYLFYYKSLQNMINSRGFDFDIIAHFDLPKKFNDIPINKEAVHDEMMKTLEEIKKHKLTMEINTGGLRKDCKEQYPSIQIIKEMYALDIPILLGSDAHNPEVVAWQFDKTIETLKKIGFTQLAHFNRRKRDFLEI